MDLRHPLPPRRAAVAAPAAQISTGRRASIRWLSGDSDGPITTGAALRTVSVVGLYG